MGADVVGINVGDVVVLDPLHLEAVKWDNKEYWLPFHTAVMYVKTNE